MTEFTLLSLSTSAEAGIIVLSRGTEREKETNGISSMDEIFWKNRKREDEG